MRARDVYLPPRVSLQSVDVRAKVFGTASGCQETDEWLPKTLNPALEEIAIEPALAERASGFISR